MSPIKYFIVLLFGLHYYDKTVLAQCWKWNESKNNWRNVRCKEPKQGSDDLIMFPDANIERSTVVLNMTERNNTENYTTTAKWCDPTCPPSFPPSPKSIVTFDDCMSLKGNGGWWHGWCFSNEWEWEAGKEECTKYRHGRMAYVPDENTLNVVKLVLEQWNDKLLSNSSVDSDKYHIGLQYFDQRKTKWWQWKLSNSDLRPVTPFERKPSTIFWSDGQPNDPGDNCAYYDRNTNGITDSNCEGDRWIICQYPRCKDNRKLCPVWASEGECDNNPVWMDKHCQKSCSCACIDRNPRCEQYAKKGECELKDSSWMDQFCKKSCNKCPFVKHEGSWLWNRHPFILQRGERWKWQRKEILPGPAK